MHPKVQTFIIKIIACVSLCTMTIAKAIIGFKISTQRWCSQVSNTFQSKNSTDNDVVY